MVLIYYENQGLFSKVGDLLIEELAVGIEPKIKGIIGISAN